MFKISANVSSLDRPKRRPLKIYAADPMIGRNLGNRARVDIENEESLRPGPSGERICVVDFNASTGKYYPPVDLNDPHLLMQGGLEPSESDPRFHQQMVYAVAMRTLENFDKALGRKIYLSKRGMPLRLFPHAFYGANAYFDESLHAVVFGYFRADQAAPGENLPNQSVFTCLSHDIIAHEMTHAIVNRLRRNFLEPSNVDVLAFHEGFSDIVALFQHFSFIDVVRAQIQKTGWDLRKASDLLGLAPQFGHATATGRALRSALGEAKLQLRDDIIEPHERGAILVAAVFDAFMMVYERRTADLVRLTGSQNLEPRSIHPDVVNRLAGEAARIAQSMLTMCIRAFDYMPPVDVCYGDFLRAMVTADRELSPEDELGQRAAVIEGFRQRRIYPEGVQSLAEESLVWDPADNSLPPLRWKANELLDLIVDAASQISSSSTPSQKEQMHLYSKGSSSSSPLADQFYEEDFEEGSTSTSTPLRQDPRSRGRAVNKALGPLARELHDYARKNAERLDLDPDTKIRPLGVHPVFRVAPNGRLSIELVAQVDQVRNDDATLAQCGGLPLRGGTTLVIDFNGRIKYMISKPLPSAHLSQASAREATARLNKQLSFTKLADANDPMVSYLTAEDYPKRAKLRASFANLHFTR